MIVLIIVFIVLLVTAILLRVYRMKVLQWVMNLRSILRIRSLRVAIKDADKDKEDTKRKNMVLFNTHSGEYEPLQKKLLKHIERKSKNKNNAKQTPGRKKFAQRKKKILNSSVNEIQKKSLYVTE